MTNEQTANPATPGIPATGTPATGTPAPGTPAPGTPTTATPGTPANPPTGDAAIYGTKAEPKPPRVYSVAEQVLVGVGLGLAILWDRLVALPYMHMESWLAFGAGIFWLGYLVVFYAVYWRKLKHNRVLWMVGAFVAALCIWNLLFDYRSSYGQLTLLVIPAVVMAHNLYAAGGYNLKQVGAFTTNWLCGWLVKPFSALPMLFGAAHTLVSGEKRSNLRRVGMGLLCTLPLIAVLLPLLGSADMVFQYHLDQLLGGFDPISIIGHLIIVGCVTGLLYSFLWNVGFAPQAVVKPGKTLQFDRVVSTMVLGSVCLLYLIFCVMQFTYLFAGAGLPEGMTYAEYAREGFGQILFICGFNLLLFGVFLQYGAGGKLLGGMLCALLTMTGVMLVSSFVRLRLYIAAYGMTWLRLLSMWFILYLGVVILLAAVRIRKRKLPLIAVCAFLLLGWYTALGYANPDALILRTNLARESSVAVWMQENSLSLSRLSDDGMLVLSAREDHTGESRDELVRVMQERRKWPESGKSLSSWRLSRTLPY